MTEVINLDDILKNKCVFSMGNTSCINPHHWLTECLTCFVGFTTFSTHIVCGVQ